MIKCMPIAIAGPRTFLAPLMKPTVGAENLPRSGPCIVAANHSSLLDGIVLTAWTAWLRKLPTHTIAYDDPFKHWFMGWMLRSARCIPFARGDQASSRAMLGLALGYLARGEAVGIFPEAHLNNGKRLRRARPGAGLLALEAGVPVVPIGLRGTAEVMPQGAAWPRLGIRGQMWIGSPLSTSEASARYHDCNDPRERVDIVQGFLERLMGEITNLSGLEPPPPWRKGRRP